MKKIFFVLVIFLLVSPAFAVTPVKVKVNGLVCDFCVQAVKKMFGKKPEVAGIDVNLDSKIITISLNEGKNLSDDDIKNDITNAGYNVVGIER